MKLKENIALSNSGFVFDSNTGDSYNLNSIGQDILNLLKESKTIDEIHDILIKEYEVDSGLLENSIYDFLSMLRQFNLLDNEK
ncbi:MAG: PqqD family peptide modification chaperone [Bacteroidales bacterium]|nr:PqqD family peptide modification chaperone [Bacteroidales bacterium]